MGVGTVTGQAARWGGRARRGRGRARALAAVTLSAVTALALVVRPAPATADDDDGLRFEADWTYTVDPAARAVHVSADIAVTNELSDPGFYFHSLVLPVVGQATALTATRDDGAGLTVTTAPTADPGAEQVTLDISPDIFPGQTARVRLSYDLVDSPDRPSRINEAIVAFVALAVGDPGLSNVEIVVPAALETSVATSSGLERTRRDDQTVFTARAIAEPDRFGPLVVARDDDRLVSRGIDVGDRTVQLRGWPSDPGWLDVTADQVTRGLPVLDELTGVPWQVTGPDDGLEIVEAIDPHGFAGSYSTLDRIVTVDDSRSPQLLYHELAHLWFNNRLFTERWLREGFAEEYAARVQEALGSPLPQPDPVDPGGPGSLPLATWEEHDRAGAIDVDRETYGYAASWSVVRSLSAEIGMDRLRDVVIAESERLMAYRGDGLPEAGRHDGWKTLLDQLEEVGGSTGASRLFATWVADEPGRAQLAERAAARLAYDQLEAAGGQWAPPLGVRAAMSRWDFDVATARIATAQQILMLSIAAEQAAAPLDVGAPDALEAIYEEASELDGARAVAEQSVEAAAALVDADAQVSADRGLLATVGLLGSDPGGDLRAAVTAYESAEPAAAITAADDVSELVDGAAAAGRLRLAVAALVVAVAGAATIAVRHSRGRPPDDAGDGDARDPAPPGPPRAHAGASPPPAPPAPAARGHGDATPSTMPSTARPPP